MKSELHEGSRDELNALAESYFSAYDCCFEERLAGCDCSIYYDADDQTFWASSSGIQEWCEFTSNVTINDFDPMNTYESQDPGREEFVKMCMECFDHQFIADAIERVEADA